MLKFLQPTLLTVTYRMNPTETKVQKWKETKEIQRDIKRHVGHIPRYVVYVLSSLDEKTGDNHAYIILSILTEINYS